MFVLEHGERKTIRSGEEPEADGGNRVVSCFGAYVIHLNFLCFLKLEFELNLWNIFLRQVLTV
jgi:hypothetical protein